MDEERYALGQKVRQQVLGDAHTAAASAKETQFAAPLRDLVTEFCWGAVWGRGGLPLAHAFAAERRDAAGDEP